MSELTLAPIRTEPFLSKVPAKRALGFGAGRRKLLVKMGEWVIAGECFVFVVVGRGVGASV